MINPDDRKQLEEIYKLDLETKDTLDRQLMTIAYNLGVARGRKLEQLEHTRSLKVVS
jgi:uncharacterized protein (DUF885 family)